MSGREPIERVRVGLVGAGFMAKTHSLAFSAAAMLDHDEIPPIERRRIADVDERAARLAADRFGWGDATTDWREVTRADDVDLVDIVTPNDSHAEIALDATRHGKHILCEKPLAASLADATRMADAAERAGITTQVGFVFRTWPATAAARQLIDKGEIGEILSFRAHYFHDFGLDPEFPMGWRVDRSRAGGGSILDLGSHVADIARYLVGDIAAVTARSRTHMARRPSGGEAGQQTGEPGRSSTRTITVDDATDCLVEFSSGALGTLSTNWMAAGYKTDIGFEVCGRDGAIRFTWRRNNELQVYSHAGDPSYRGFKTISLGPLHPGAGRFWPVAGQGLGYGDAFTILIANLLAALARGSPAVPDFSDGREAARFVDAALRSAEQGASVEIGPTPSRAAE